MSRFALADVIWILETLCASGFRAKNVVRLQHKATTSRGRPETPKKAAVAGLFGFPQRVSRRRLRTEMQSMSLCLTPSKSD